MFRRGALLRVGRNLVKGGYLRWEDTGTRAMAHGLAPFSSSAAGAVRLIDAYARFGHLKADIDPLGLHQKVASSLDPLIYFPKAELDTPFEDSVKAMLSSSQGISVGAEVDTPRKLIKHMEGIYCGKIGFQYEHLDSLEEREWFAKMIRKESKCSTAERINAAVIMLQADVFENFLAKKFPSFKRYSGEGAEALHVAMNTLFNASAASGVQDIVISKAHRGRLALLVSQLGYPASRLFHKIRGNSEFPSESGLLDDVTSHLGASIDIKCNGGKDKVHVSLIHNSSHLEIGHSVAQGKARAKRAGGSGDALCVQVHGDSAMAGQGCVSECFSHSQIPGMEVGGSVHIVVNNQIGFTTQGKEARSSTYCSDIAKMVDAPVLHVNTNCVESVVRATKIAVDYRKAFGKDVVIDLVAYRKFGHNEVDEPSFTNPLMYSAIKGRVPPAEAYAGALQAQGILTAEKVESLRKRFETHLDKEFAAAADYSVKSHRPDAFGGKWQGYGLPTNVHETCQTGAPLASLVHSAVGSVTVPEGFNVHPRLKRSHIDARLKHLEEGK